jgi:hypothetical protein
MTRLLGCVFVAAEIKHQEGICHVFNIGGCSLLCQAGR